MAGIDIEKLTIIISHEDDQATWFVAKNELTFTDTLSAISRLLPNVVVTAFEYEDDEGDRITVRSNEELQTMYSAYIEEVQGNVSFRPMMIFPRVSKRPQDRNVHHLKIKTKSESAANKRTSDLMDTTVSSNHPLDDIIDSQTQNQTTLSSTFKMGAIDQSQLQFIKILATGSGGSVYRAIHGPSGVIMAVKLIKLDVTPDIQKQILREFSILDQCTCPHIIKCFGTFFIDNQISICAEYMDGGSLDRYGQVPHQVLGRVSVCIVQGLLYLWSKKIMHRDIKPSNILVNSAGEVKLCDFGVSIQMVNSMANTYIGTNAYMAPERILGEDYSLPAEIWSLGVTIFELATGKFPYSTPSASCEPMTLLSCILNQSPPQLPSQYFTAHLIDFVSQCMKHKPGCRLKGSSIEAHPYIQRNNDNRTDLISSWVISRLQQQQQKQRKT